MPGFLVSAHVLGPAAVPAFFQDIFMYAWFVGFAIALGLHGIAGIALGTARRAG